MRFTMFLALFLLVYSACNEGAVESSAFIIQVPEVDGEFDKSKWRVKKGAVYPHRDEMLDDLVYSDTIRSLEKDQLLDLPGEPDRTHAGHLYYRITERRLWFWTLHTKTMVIKLTEQDTIEWIKIHK